MHVNMYMYLYAGVLAMSMATTVNTRNLNATWTVIKI